MAVIFCHIILYSVFVYRERVENLFFCDFLEKFFQIILLVCYISILIIYTKPVTTLCVVKKSSVFCVSFVCVCVCVCGNRRKTLDLLHSIC
jgi:hypothetical protein